ncbi:hypothetical protein [Helicobacter pylori]|uniref:hypothetical protein n=1 Tax=Helicobacter pylori TaxID=210 RepID=UPI001FD5E82E|nr:hypothetical protein [Helicobacter pylori]UOR68637.1 hypothetical protein MPF90_04135 [Helicobacter pylori]
MKQRVRTVSYLAKAEFELNNGVYDLVALPSGAEVVKVSLEVVGEPAIGINGTVRVGFKDEGQRGYFLSAQVSAGMSAMSTRDYTAVSNMVIVAQFNHEEQSATIEGGNKYAKGVLRVVYFLPSETEVEY